MPAGPGGAPSAPVPHSVPGTRAVAWFSWGMALFKRAPLAWIALGACTLLLQLVLQLVPAVGNLLDKVLMPLVGAGLLVAAAAAARGEKPSPRHLFVPFTASAGAVLAIVLSGLVTFGVEALVLHALTGANVLLPDSVESASMSASSLLGAFAIGVLASLPLTFVPLLVLFAGQSPGASLAGSLRAFAVNVPALLVYGAIGLALLAFGVITMGIGLVIVFPLWATATWAAWIDVFPERERADPRAAS